MSLLLDTHAFLWFIDDDRRLSEVARKEITGSDEVFVSIASLWEIAIKVGIGKLAIPKPIGPFLEAELNKNSLALRPITIAHLDQVTELQLHHRDPFDRMLIAQAICEQLTLVSVDVAFDAYGVRRLW